MLRQNLIKYTPQRIKITLVFLNFLEGAYAPNYSCMRAPTISLFPYENSNFLIKILIKYKLKRINCKSV